jgi:stage II sporulation protein AA (anti-sigma F factor antagonist)
MESLISQVGNAQVVALSGRIDPEAAMQVKTVLEPLLSGSSPRLVVNLADVDFIGSAGLRQIFVGAREMKKRGGELVLCDLQPEVKRIFVLAALPIRIADTQAEALA